MDLNKVVEREKCRRSAHHFIFESQQLVTKDEHDIDTPLKPFPDDPYLRALLDSFLVSGRLIKPSEALWALEDGENQNYLETIAKGGIVFVEKSRQMLVSWLTCSYCLWRARSYPHQLILVQSKREDDAANLVYTTEPPLARISFMEWALPDWLRMVQFPKGCKFGHIYFPNGSHIWAIPEGSDIIRSNTTSVLFSDEAAFQPEFGNAYTAALPSIKGGAGQGIFVSSAEPGEFCDLVEGLA